MLRLEFIFCVYVNVVWYFLFYLCLGVWPFLWVNVFYLLLLTGLLTINCAYLLTIKLVFSVSKLVLIFTYTLHLPAAL